MRKLYLVFFVLLIPSHSFAENETSEAAIEKHLSSYISTMQKAFPPGKTNAKKDKSLILISSKTSQFWQIKKGDTDPPNLRAAGFFAIYRPDKWEVENLKFAGDFAKVIVNFHIGSPSMQKVSRDKNLVTSFSLIKKDEKWLLVDFVNKTSKERKKELEETRERKEKAADELVKDASNSEYQEVVIYYLDAVEGIFEQAEGSAVHAQLPLIFKKTDPYWKKSRELNRLKTQHASQLGLKFPFARTLVSAQQADDTNARVVVNIATKSTNELVKKMHPPKDITYSLEKIDGKWLIANVH